ncbi:MAG: tetratricopeptide repeat protein [Anaerolineae bacterium]|nr:MAG: tetratricopeptide repeat protein [Anaerolineae bacterium]
MDNRYNTPMAASRTPARVLGVLFLLLVLVSAPSTLLGLQDVQQADRAWRAGLYEVSATHYQNAARRLPWRGDLWERAGLAALRAGQPDRALDFLQRADRSAGLSPEGRLALGDALWQEGNRLQALKTWETLHADGFLSEDLYRRLAMVYDGPFFNFPAAIEAYRGLLTLSPQDAGARYRLGLLLTVESPSEAFTELNRAAQEDPSLATSAQEMTLALGAALSQDDEAYRFARIGQGLAALGEWRLAEMAFARAHEVNTAYAEAWALHGEAAQHLGTDGRAYLDEALRLGPDSPLVRVLRGLYWQRRGDAARAVNELERAVALEPQNPAWRVALGEAYAQAGEIPAALAEYRYATELAPQEALYWRLLAAFCVHYGVHLEDVGLPAAQRAVLLAPETPSSLDILGWAYLHLGQIDEAKMYLQRALDADPDLAAAHLHMAVLYLQQGQLAPAYPHLLRARDLGADAPEGQQAEELIRRYFP